MNIKLTCIQANGDIRLATRDPKETCMDGTWCSYACPPGYSKAQWPAEQPSSGESIGGLVCKNGKLWLTRSTSRKLCTAGADNTKIVNNLGQGVAICRTDYPGMLSLADLVGPWILTLI